MRFSAFLQLDTLGTLVTIKDNQDGECRGPRDGFFFSLVTGWLGVGALEESVSHLAYALWPAHLPAAALAIHKNPVTSNQSHSHRIEASTIIGIAFSHDLGELG